MSYIGNNLQVAYPSYTNIDDISGSFNGVTTSFALTVGGVAPVPAPLSSNQCMISVGGVIQRPDDTGTEGFRLSGGNIVFSSAPNTGEDFFGVILAGADYVNVGVNYPSGSASTPSITFDSDLDTGLYNPAANELGITTAGTSRLVVDSSGNVNIDSNTLYVDAVNNRVGVGTTSPDSPLSVVVNGSNPSISSATILSLTRSGSAGSGAQMSVIGGNASGCYLNFGDTDDEDIGRIGYSHSANALLFNANGDERMRIDSSGRLLVGTSSSLDTPSYYKIQATAPDAAFLVLARDDSTTITNNLLGAIRFGGNGGGGSYGFGAQIDAAADETHTSSSKASRLVFSTTPSGSASPTERMRIDSNGVLTTTSDASNDYALRVTNDGNSTNRFGLRIQCGRDDSTGSNIAVNFSDGDGTVQGYITFTSGTVTYGAFTAHHLCSIPDADNENGYPYGTLLEVTGIKYTQKDGKNTERGILYDARKTQSANSRAVLGAYGVSMNGGPDGETNCHQVLVLGDGHILCNNSGGDIKVGDGICSSAAPGIGQKATATPSMVIGIAQEDVAFTDGEEIKLVAVQYGLHQFTPWAD